MANDLTGNPWFVDIPQPTPLTMKHWNPIAIRWVNATQVGDIAVVSDGQGHQVWYGVADSTLGTSRAI
jgi:hypothetical protein